MKTHHGARLVQLSLGLACTFDAAANSYVGLSFSDLSYSSADFSGTLSMGSLGGRFGAFIDEHTSIEWRIASGVANDTLQDREYRFGMDLMYGAHVRAGLPLGAYIFPYLSIGYTWLELNHTSGNLSMEERLEDVSVGAGIDFLVSRRIAINLEYQQYVNEAPIEIKGASLGASYRY